jgi:hypothetical protein
MISTAKTPLATARKLARGRVSSFQQGGASLAIFVIHSMSNDNANQNPRQETVAA